MASIHDLAMLFASEERPDGNLLAPEQVIAQAVAASRMYAGYGRLDAHGFNGAQPEVTQDTVLNVSEWAVIRPLFLLYVERENALQLEASRGLGVEVFGRDSSSIAADIAQVEADIPMRAFFRAIMTI